MPKPTFDLADELDLLEWDFTPRGEERKSGPHGIVAEPSAGQITAFTQAIRRLVGPALTDAAGSQDIAMMSPAEMAAKLAEAEATDAAGIETLGKLIVAVSDVCSGSPSAEEISALPYRGQQAFFGYVVGTFIDPNQSASATS